TETLKAREILVAARLVDGALAAPFGFERLYRHTVRLYAAIPATLAHQFVDDHPLVRIRKGLALAAAAVLRCAGLIVDEDRDAGNAGELDLQFIELVAMMNRESAWPFGIARIFVWLVGDDDDAPGPFGGHLARHLRHSKAAVVGLTTGHRDGVVEQKLVGDIH